MESGKSGLRLEDYDYELPKALIAQQPIARRDGSRMMVMRSNGDIGHDHFRNLPEYFEKNDVLVMNDSKVVPAKLEARRATGGRVDLLVFERFGMRTGRALCRGKVREGDMLDVGHFRAEVRTKEEGSILVEFDSPLGKVLSGAGKMPLPPYIKAELDDGDRYQTVYASEEGSVAAPTAGLHFTPELLKALKRKGANLAYITLHINIGTFLPVDKGNRMPERFKIEEKAADLINETKENGGRIFVVGTSTFKALESACRNGRIIPGEGSSDLFISPPYEFGFRPSAMLTNFHLPRSSVLLLTCAFAGRDMILDGYREAVSMKYRFYSFGDSNLIFRDWRAHV